MEDIIKKYLEQVKIGRKQSFKNLAIYPLLSTYSVPLDYLTLALDEQILHLSIFERSERSNETERARE